MTLEEIHKQIRVCAKCPLHKTRTNAVPGEGSPDAEIMFIGEAPGLNEDLQGRPFVGAAGKFLDEMLESCGIKREDVFITNIVKSRPPGNRDPLPEEVEACWPWLETQINLINPLLIVILGRHSLEKFLPGVKISQVHGQALRREAAGIGRRVFFAAYHPAAALHNGGLRSTLISDFKKIPKLLKQLKKGNSGNIANDDANEGGKSKQEKLF